MFRRQIKEHISTTTVVIHDVDRDGLGSAAMICAEIGPEHVQVEPTKPKDLKPLLERQLGNRDILVLDLPALENWSCVSSDVNITWVDHHLSSWSNPPPSNVKTVLPTDQNPTTTMSLLVKHNLVSIPNVMHNYVRRLCGGLPHFDWAHIFDAMDCAYPDWLIGRADLPRLLAPGPKGEAVPEELTPFMKQGLAIRKECERILNDAPTQFDDDSVIVEIADAKNINLKNFSMETQRRYPNRTTILVHRNSFLYCGRESRKVGLNFLSHFQSRGFDPKGHSYVTWVRIGKDRIRSELDVLLRKLKEINLQ